MNATQNKFPAIITKCKIDYTHKEIISFNIPNKNILEYNRLTKKACKEDLNRIDLTKIYEQSNNGRHII